MNSLISSSGEPAIPSLVKSDLLTTPAKSIHEVCALNSSRKARRAIYNDLFNNNDLDGLLMPPGPHTAMPHEKWGPINYTALWNYLDFPACVIPVGKVTSQDVKYREAIFGIADQSLYDLCKASQTTKTVRILQSLTTSRYRSGGIQRGTYFYPACWPSIG